MGGLGAFVCLSVAAMASYVVRDRRVWEVRSVQPRQGLK